MNHFCSLHKNILRGVSRVGSQYFHVFHFQSFWVSVQFLGPLRCFGTLSQLFLLIESQKSESCIRFTTSTLVEYICQTRKNSFLNVCLMFLNVDFYNSSINTVLITRRKLRFSVLKRPGTPPLPRRNGCSASHYTITEHNQFSTYGAFEHYF